MKVEKITPDYITRYPIPAINRKWSNHNLANNEYFNRITLKVGPSLT